jgi:hypothetical protein
MMGWFERHLNWSLVLGLIIVPFIVNLPLTLFQAKLGQTGFIISMVVGLILTLFSLVLTWWYLSRKQRSKLYFLLLLVPWTLTVIGFVLTGGIIGSIFSIISTGKMPPSAITGFIILSLASISAIAGFIWLLCLKNKAIGYGGDFAGEVVTSGWPGTLPPSVLDDRQLKELDYTPDKNVMDMVGGPKTNDVGDTKDITDIGAGGAARVTNEQAAAAEKAPAEEQTEEIKVVARPVSPERLNMPVLMDSAGVAIKCFYHAGADAVNLCSRCKQYVCIECNYVTGTHPICHNCWEKRGEIRLAPPVQKASPPPHKAEKPKTAEVAVPEKQEKPEPKQPEAPVLVESAKPVEPVEPTEPTEPMGPIEAGVTEPEPQKIVASPKTAKLDAEKSQWQQEFMALYQQTIPIVNVIIAKGSDNMPASPLDLMEGLKLRPMLERTKKLSKPRDKELRGARSEFEQVLSSCIKIADAASNFVSGGGQALLGGPDFKRIVSGIETANELMEKLSQKVATFPRAQE